MYFIPFSTCYCVNHFNAKREIVETGEKLLIVMKSEGIELDCYRHIQHGSRGMIFRFLVYPEK